jgi:two-component sensor histidine kinase
MRLHRSLLITLLLFAFSASRAQQDSLPRLLAIADSVFPSDTSLYYSQLAYTKAASRDDKKRIVEALILQSKFFRYKTLPDSSEKKIEEGLSIAWSVNDPSMTAGLMQEKGKLLKMQKRDDEALESLLNSLNIYSVLNDDLGVAKVQIDIGEYYRSVGRYDDAGHFLAEALRAHQKRALPKNVLISLYSRIAAVKNETGNPDSALHYSSLALEMSRETGNLHMQAVSLNELGFMYENKGNDKAKDYYSQAIELWDKLGNDLYKFNAVVNLSRYYHKKKKIDESIRLLNSILPRAENEQWTLVTLPAYNQMAANYRELGDYKQAYLYSEKSKDATIQQFQKNYEREIQDITNRYELEKKNRQLLEKEQELKEGKAAYEVKSREEKFLIAGAVLLVLLSAGLLYLARQRSKANKQLEHTLHEKETLFKELHHRVKNNFSILSGLLHLQEVHTTDPQAIKALQESQSRIHSMAIIHQDLYLHSNITEIDFEAVVKKLFAMLEHSLLPPGKEVEAQIDCCKMKLQVETAIPLALILHELITNSFKYGLRENGKTIIGVKMQEMEKNCTLEIYDNGPGIPAGVQIKDGDTLGLKLTTMLASQIEAQVGHKNENGSHFIITFRC